MFTVTQIQDKYMKITGGRQVHCHTNTRQIYENYRWEAGSQSHKYKTNIWKLQVGGRFTVTQIQDEYMKITGGRQVHRHTNTRRIYENYRWEAGSLSHKYKRNIWKLQVGGSAPYRSQVVYRPLSGSIQVIVKVVSLTMIWWYTTFQRRYWVHHLNLKAAAVSTVCRWYKVVLRLGRYRLVITAFSKSCLFAV